MAGREKERQAPNVSQRTWGRFGDISGTGGQPPPNSHLHRPPPKLGLLGNSFEALLIQCLRSSAADSAPAHAQERPKPGRARCPNQDAEQTTSLSHKLHKRVSYALRGTLTCRSLGQEEPREPPPDQASRLGRSAIFARGRRSRGACGSTARTLVLSHDCYLIRLHCE